MVELRRCDGGRHGALLESWDVEEIRFGGAGPVRKSETRNGKNHQATAKQVAFGWCLFSPFTDL